MFCKILFFCLFFLKLLGNTTTVGFLFYSIFYSYLYDCYSLAAAKSINDWGRSTTRRKCIRDHRGSSDKGVKNLSVRLTWPIIVGLFIRQAPHHLQWYFKTLFTLLISGPLPFSDKKLPFNLRLVFSFVKGATTKLCQGSDPLNSFLFFGSIFSITPQSDSAMYHRRTPENTLPRSG